MELGGGEDRRPSRLSMLDNLGAATDGNGKKMGKPAQIKGIVTKAGTEGYST